ncbi:hypothetical protein F4809DRAFT_508163 [Biscogniauxia mediterranea]|nr:hypothetical protein F4809DRAFT_508163 [Biscogniauxia mediterranea]
MGIPGIIKDDRPRSFGIGGAGNIRTRAEAVVQDIVPSDEHPRRRRSSLWSLGSSSNSNGESRSFKLPAFFRTVSGGSSHKSDPDTSK